MMSCMNRYEWLAMGMSILVCAHEIHNVITCKYKAKNETKAKLTHLSWCNSFFHKNINSCNFEMRLESIVNTGFLPFRKGCLTCARQKDVNSHVILPGNSSFCQTHTLKVLTPTSTYRQFIICMSYFVKMSYQARFCLQISYHASLFTMLL